MAKKRKRGAGRPVSVGGTEAAKFVGLKLPKALIERAAKWRKVQSAPMTQSAAYRELIDRGLKGDGF